MNWISVKERKPERHQRALVVVNMKTGTSPPNSVNIVTVAEYIPHKSVKSEDFLCEEFSGSGDVDWYDEAEDCYWVNEGFWESSIEADTNWRISDAVTHWMPLPLPPMVSEEEHGRRGRLDNRSNFS